MDSDTLDVLKESLAQKIQAFDSLLGNQAVRGHLDTSFRSPNVDARSSIKSLLLRLHRQVHAACVLADVCHLGPAPSAEEQNVLAEVKNGLYLLDEAITPLSSLEGSSTV
ncbi:unnamed protein product [Caenorhabditis auriculariae]|uniref:Uncharacterized protein n=1 Tax=Caenorhabditis auriculariae TaxID=2777116 RepID=A0A8S1HVI0_9PELO|nr:unnamed protein product [Caenorhabditis auriculariae]